jgi:hypothetical protein
MWIEQSDEGEAKPVSNEMNRLLRFRPNLENSSSTGVDALGIRLRCLQAGRHHHADRVKLVGDYRKGPFRFSNLTGKI